MSHERRNRDAPERMIQSPCSQVYFPSTSCKDIGFRILDVYDISCHFVLTSELGNVLPPLRKLQRGRMNGVREGKLTPRHDIQTYLTFPLNNGAKPIETSLSTVRDARDGKH